VLRWNSEVTIQLLHGFSVSNIFFHLEDSQPIFAPINRKSFQLFILDFPLLFLRRPEALYCSGSEGLPLLRRSL
jgi:hypothetical protein